MGMSISSASASSVYQSSGTSNLQQRRQEFQALGQALKAGDLAGAQKAFAALNPNASSSTQPTQSAQSSSNNFSQLAQALQSGDLAGAQKAFAAITSSHGHGHHHHQAAAASTPSTGSIAPIPASTSTVGSNINVAA
jgi:DNA-binding FadR family transcriptional regulator